MGNQESVPSPAGEEEVDASPQEGNDNDSKSKQLSPQYIEGVSELKSCRREKSKHHRSSKERHEKGEAREEESRDSLAKQQHNKRISPASANSDSITIQDKFPSTTGGKKRISDDQVHLDLPMAELMAYLQMVANHSSNLPLTRRDDPDLGRTVSSLTADEYAFKCAAFMPSKITILGGQFGKYGRVWDLPTSEVSSNEIMVFMSAFFVLSLQ